MIISALKQLVEPLSCMNMDFTHIDLLHEVLRLGKFASALEIGSYDGASAVAFVSALNNKFIKRVSFCDVSFKPRFHRVMGKCFSPDAVELLNMRSIEAIKKCANVDFVFVDGDHSFQTVSEEIKLILESGIAHIAAHDTNATDAGFKLCEGAKHLRDVLKAAPEYYVLEDKMTRAGERTDRGFLFATKRKELWLAMKDMFKE